MEGEKKSVGEASGPGISWSTGIAEVALPIDYKLQNIEATEIARKRIEEEKNNSPHQIGQSMNSSKNFLLGQFNRNSNTNNQGHQLSTDDKTLERFRKRLHR